MLPPHRVGMTRRRTCVWVTLAVAIFGCRKRESKVDYESNDLHVFSREERAAIDDIAEHSVQDIRRVLPGLPSSIVMRVHASRSVIPETGENASNWQPNGVDWQVDADRPEGVTTIARRQLRATLFHELHHVVRAAVVDGTRLRDHIVREGLGTAFERDFAGVTPPWADYGPDAASVAKELLTLPDDTPRGPWLLQHPDGRRWVGMRAGTFLVDCAMKASGKTSAAIVQIPTDTLLQMCVF